MIDSKGSWHAIFDQKLKKLKDTGEYRVFRPIERINSGGQDWTTLFKKKEILNFCSNDYLSMSTHPEVVDAAVSVVCSSGVGAGGSRNIAGSYLVHPILERELADLHGYDQGLVFTSGYLANYVPLLSIGTHIPGLIFYSDEKNHASMIDAIGVVTRDQELNCEKRIFRHNDVQHLAELMAADDPQRPKLVVFESLYSVDADQAPIQEICDVGIKHNALIFLNEVHTAGIYGPQGAGLLFEQGATTRPHIVVGTLGKSFGAIGGYMVGDETTVDFVRSFGRGFIFTTSLPPSIVAAATAAIRHLRESTSERDQMWDRVSYLKQLLNAGGIPFDGDSHIIPVMVGDAKKNSELSNRLLDEGFLVTAINYPTVARGTERLRVITTPAHSRSDVKRFAEALDRLWTEFRLPRKKNSAERSICA